MKHDGSCNEISDRANNPFTTYLPDYMENFFELEYNRW